MMDTTVHPFVLRDTAPSGTEDLVRAIAALARGASVEAMTCDLGQLDEAAQWLPKGSTVSIPWLRSDTRDDRVAAARAVRAAGFAPLPHIAARGLFDAADADCLLRRLRDEADVSQLVLIGGGGLKPSGDLESALELLARSRPGRLGYRTVGFGGYPEAHPTIPSAMLDDELDTKIAVAQDAGLDPFVITQFAFAAQPIMQWLQRFRDRCNDAPVRIGLAGPASLRTLLGYARICGIGPSSRALVNNGASIARLLTDATPAPLVRMLAAGGIAEEFAPVGLHFLSFGGLEHTVRWVAQVAAGSIRLHSSESGFALDGGHR